MYVIWIGAGYNGSAAGSGTPLPTGTTAPSYQQPRNWTDESYTRATLLVRRRSSTGGWRRATTRGRAVVPGPYPNLDCIYIYIYI